MKLSLEVKMNRKTKSYLIYKNANFFCSNDQYFFYERLKRIKCIISTEWQGDDIIIHLKRSVLTEDNMYDFLFLFKRYQIDMTQLRPFLNEKNETWFKNTKDAYWYKPLFGND